MKFPGRYFSVLIITSILIVASCSEKSQEKAEIHKISFDTSSIIQTICFGSCNKQWEDQSYWKTIAQENPDLWIWMGDIIYSDTEDMMQLENQYNIQKKHKEYQKFTDSTMVVGVWDDHDYGVNDGGREYPKREESRDLLFDFLEIQKGNPAWNRQGAYQVYEFGPAGKKVKVFLLDGRYFKDPLSQDEFSEQRYLQNIEGTYLGEDQWTWLEKELFKSKAKLNLIISGVQVIPTQQYFEKWSNFPKERQRLFDLIAKSGIEKPIILSGDRHIAEVSRIEIDSAMMLYEVTSSGLTHSYEKADEENEYRISPLIVSKNYGKINLSWVGEQPKVVISIHDIDGTELFSFPL